jgi:hypothetical protein
MSIADELIKLEALRQSGVLTQEEFDTVKARLIGGRGPSAEDEKGEAEEEDFETEEESEDEIVAPTGFGGALRAWWDGEELWNKAASEPASGPPASGPPAGPLVNIPDLFPLPSPHFLVFARDGRMDFGWEQSGFYIKARERTRYSFPLTPDGWAAAWDLMCSEYPQLAAKVASVIERDRTQRADSQKRAWQPLVQRHSGNADAALIIGGIVSAVIGYILHSNGSQSLVVCQAANGLNQALSGGNTQTCSGEEALVALGICLLVLGAALFAVGGIKLVSRSR